MKNLALITLVVFILMGCDLLQLKKDSANELSGAPNENAGGKASLDIDTKIVSIIPGETCTISISAKKTDGSLDKISFQSSSGLVMKSSEVSEKGMWKLQLKSANDLYGDDTVSIQSESGLKKTLTVRVTDPLALHSEGLLIRLVNTFDRVWEDRGSGVSTDLSIWNPQVPTGYFMLGSLAFNGYATSPVKFSDRHSIVVKEINQSGALAKPTGFVSLGTLQFNSKVHIYYPVAPHNYVAMGVYAVASEVQPDPNTTPLRCVREDLVSSSKVGGPMWFNLSGIVTIQNYFFDILDTMNDPNVAKEDDQLLLDPGTFLFYASIPGSGGDPNGRGAYVLKLRSPIMEWRGNDTYVPSLSSITQTEGTKLPMFSRRVVSVPWFLLTDGMIVSSDKYQYSPFYRISRESYYVVGQVRPNQTSVPYTLTLTSTTGITNSMEKTNWETNGIQMSAEIGFKYAKANFTSTKTLGFATTTSTSEFSQSAVSDQLVVPPGKVGALLQKCSDLTILRRDSLSGIWEDRVNNILTVNERNIVPSEFSLQ